MTRACYQGPKADLPLISEATTLQKGISDL